MKARDFLSRSFRLIGVIGSGDTLSADDANDGLSTLNDLIDSWSNEKLMVPREVREEFALTPGVQSYQIGNGAAFNSIRPMEILRASILIDTQEHPVTLLTKELWPNVFDKSISSAIPTNLYFERTYPNATLHVWPKPTVDYKIVLYSWKPLEKIETLDDDLIFPPGYARALRYSLAIELAPEYGRPIDTAIAAIAEQAKDAIKTVNSDPQYMTVDNALTYNRRSNFNIYTGDMNE